MEDLILYYYSYKPRMRVYRTVRMQLPIIGDKIHVPKEWITEMNKDRKTMIFGLDFIVKERYAYFANNADKCKWTITLELF